MLISLKEDEAQTRPDTGLSITQLKSSEYYNFIQ
jgi:hypothetical protein